MSEGGSGHSYGEDGHPVSPIAMGSTNMCIGDSGGVGEENESEESEEGTDGLEDCFDMPFRVMLLQSVAKAGGEEWSHRSGIYRGCADTILGNASGDRRRRGEEGRERERVKLRQREGYE